MPDNAEKTSGLGMRALLQFSADGTAQTSSGLRAYSIYREAESASQQQRKEAKQAMPLLIPLQRKGILEDVRFGDDPPDLKLITADGKRIGIELTCLNRSAETARQGDAARGDFAKAKRANEDAKRFEFTWPTRTLGELIDALAYCLDDKAKTKAQDYDGDAYWLAIDCESGGTAGVHIACCFKPMPDIFMDMAGFFWKRAIELCKASAYENVLFFSSNGTVAMQTPNDLGLSCVPESLINRPGAANPALARRLEITTTQITRKRWPEPPSHEPTGNLGDAE